MVTINTKTPPSRYVVGVPAAKGFNSDCCEFSDVMHVTHALRGSEILRSRLVSGRLVYDNSTLNQSRIHVVWVSPNHWSWGFRYGTVGLTFDWETLVSTRHAYWVEVAEYRTHACRILLSQDNHPSLRTYDPTSKSGPWWHDKSTGKHYYNSDYCLEFMVEGDVPLADLRETTFVKHHDDWCSEYRTNPERCRDRGMLQQEAGARFVARLAGAGEDLAAFRIGPAQIRAAWSQIKWALTTAGGGTVGVGSEAARAISLAALEFYGTGRDADAEAMMALFTTTADAEGALKVIIEQAVGPIPLK